MFTGLGKEISCLAGICQWWHCQGRSEETWGLTLCAIWAGGLWRGVALLSEQREENLLLPATYELLIIEQFKLEGTLKGHPVQPQLLELWAGSWLGPDTMSSVTIRVALLLPRDAGVLGYSSGLGAVATMSHALLPSC